MQAFWFFNIMQCHYQRFLKDGISVSGIKELVDDADIGDGDKPLSVLRDRFLATEELERLFRTGWFKDGSDPHSSQHC